MATTLEELIVRIDADSSELRREYQRTLGETEKFTRAAGRSFDKLKTKLAAVTKSVFSFRGAVVAVAGATGLALLVRRSIETADAIGKTADKVGLSTDALQELRFAAEQAGVQQNVLDLAMQRFSRRVGEAAAGGGELKDTLEQYGIEVRNADGSTRALDAVLGDLANAIQNAASDQERLRISFKAFDSEGAALVNVLRDGADGLDAFRQQARDLGIVIDERLIRNAETAQGQLDAMSRVISAQLTTALLNLSPLLVRIAEELANAAVKAGLLFDQLSGSVGFATLATASLDELKTKLADTKQQIDDATQSLTALQSIRQGLVEGGFSDLRLVDEDISQQTDELARLEQQLRSIKAAMDDISGSTNVGTIFGGARSGDGSLQPLPGQGVPNVDLGTPFERPQFGPLGPEAAPPIEVPVALADLEPVEEQLAAFTARANESTTEIQQRFQSVAERGVSNLILALANSENSFESLREVGLSVLDDLLGALSRFVAQQLVAAAFTSAFGGGGAGGGFGLAAFPQAAGGFAEGGTIPRGKFGIVGEKGPELAIPRPSGTEIIPIRSPSVGAMSRGGGSGGVVVNISQSFDFSRSDSSTADQLRQEAENIKRESVAAVRQEVLQGGSYARDLGKR